MSIENAGVHYKHGSFKRMIHVEELEFLAPDGMRVKRQMSHKVRGDGIVLGGGSIKKRQSRLLQWRRWLIGVDVTVLVLVAVFYAALVEWPSMGAQSAEILRAVFGDQAFLRLETVVLELDDTLLKCKYDLGLSKPSAPWKELNAAGFAVISTANLDPTLIPSPTETFGSILHPMGELLTSAPAAPGMVTWQLALLKPLGSLDGEGIWSAYLQNATGRTIAERTYLQPDPGRPYAVAAVVAFDLTHTRLHFVLGSLEPYSPGGPKRSGEMPAADKAPGVLMAMFNGGFRSSQGEFGAMANGLVALPARVGMGTLVIYRDGSVRIGSWGTEITSSPDMLAWRQNGPLVIQHGKINRRVYNNSAQDWGYTIRALMPTWRSGVGLSADGKTLYYFCGPSLTIEALAKSMLDAGVDNGIQLDINPYWVDFIAVRSRVTKLVLAPLFPNAMKQNIDRFLGSYSRDYFYLTVAQ